MQLVKFLAFCLLGGLLVSGKPVNEDVTPKCGYGSCHATDSKKLNVHLVPHSHDDVGWLKTVDQYFYGSETKYQKAGVQYIIGSVVQSLQQNPDRRFIQVETAFFWQWWRQQTATVQETVRQLVNAGRLEIINGAWSMNDEAAAHYHSIIDQFTWGLRIINDTLGECGRPRIGWQIDPFGHSREMASIFSQLGYEAMFFARLDYRDSEKRHNTTTLETMWQSSQSLGAKSNLFTGVLYDFYTTPAYFCWDVLCSDVPINDDPESGDYNQPNIVERFAAYVEKGSKYFKTNNLLVTMGGDFTYQAAEMFYVNMDKLIAGFKQFRPDINIIYSTPSCYVKAVNEAAARDRIAFPLKTDDFFPYASGNHSYWTGYFTSRPNSKRFERQGNNFLQVTKQLSALSSSNATATNIKLLKEAMGIMQHHDAITGTEKQHVADDYVRIMHKAFERAERNLSDVIHGFLNRTTVKLEGVDLHSCLLSNISYCEASNANEFTVAVYNPLSRAVRHYVQLPVNATSFNITGAAGNVTYDVIPAMANFSQTHHVNASLYNLIFPVDVPALGIAYFHVKKLTALTREADRNDNPENYYGTKKTGVTLNASGHLASVTMNGITMNISQDFLYYRGTNGTNYGEENRASGAYIFRPVNGTTALPIAPTVKFTAQYNGRNVTEIHQEFSSWVNQIIRIYHDESFIEFDWMVGPIPQTDEGMEIITRFSSPLNSNAEFFTDSNGREMIKRVRNHRETYNYTNEEPVSGNYYPVTSRIVIRDERANVEVALLNDRAQGGSSLMDGQIELMLHRRLLNDDAFGVGEALNEQEFQHGVIVRGQNYLVVANVTGKQIVDPTAASIARDVAQRKLLAPWTFVGRMDKSISLADLKAKINFMREMLTRNLPTNIQILTLEPWSKNSVLLRMEHVFEKGEHPTLSNSATVDLTGLFKDLNFKSAVETTLGANQLLEDNHKLSWNITATQEEDSGYTSQKVVDLKNITMNPMEIRTFIVTV